jgi:hypothetical protein
VDVAGKIHTVAGNGTIGNLGEPSFYVCIGQYGDCGDGGLASTAQLSYPTGIAIDSAGNLYFSETGPGYIRKVTFSLPDPSSLPAAEPPQVSLPPGAYDASQTVTLSDSTPGAVIRYTLEARSPTSTRRSISSPSPSLGSRRSMQWPWPKGTQTAQWSLRTIPSLFPRRLQGSARFRVHGKARNGSRLPM